MVDTDRMRANLEAGGGVVYSQRILLALTEAGLSRDEAYRIVQRQALRAQDERADFQALVAADPEVRARLSEDELQRAFDLDDILRHAGTIVGRLSELEVREREHASV